MDRGSWIVDRGSWVVDRGSWIVDRGSWIVDRGYVIKLGEGNWVRVTGRGQLGEGNWVIANWLESGRRLAILSAGATSSGAHR